MFTPRSPPKKSSKKNSDSEKKLLSKLYYEIKVISVKYHSDIHMADYIVRCIESYCFTYDLSEKDQLSNHIRLLIQGVSSHFQEKL